jgi:hypothetical protein
MKVLISLNLKQINICLSQQYQSVERTTRHPRSAYQPKYLSCPELLVLPRMYKDLARAVRSHGPQQITFYVAYTTGAEIGISTDRS